jgi:hypothetical protein
MEYANSTPTPPAPVSAAGSLLGIFVKPRATFEALAPAPRFLLPLLVVLLAQAVLGFLVFQSGAVLNDAIAKMETKGPRAGEIEAVEQAFSQPFMIVVTMVGGTVAMAFILLVQAALYFFMANLMLGAKLTYRHYLTVACYAAVVGIVDQGIRGALALSQGTLDVRLGVGAFLGDELGFGAKMLNNLTDPFALWATAVAALGIGVFSKKSFGFGVLAVLPGFLITISLSGLQ